MRKTDSATRGKSEDKRSPISSDFSPMANSLHISHTPPNSSCLRLIAVQMHHPSRLASRASTRSAGLSSSSIAAQLPIIKQSNVAHPLLCSTRPSLPLQPLQSFQTAYTTSRYISNMSTMPATNGHSKACCNIPPAVSQGYVAKGSYEQLGGIKTCK